MSLHWQFGAEWGANKVWRRYTEEYNVIKESGELEHFERQYSLICQEAIGSSFSPDSY